MNRFTQWFYDTFVDEQLEIDEERSWEDYERLALHIMGSENMGEWGGRVGMDVIRGYLFWSWMSGVDYYTAVLRLQERMSKV